MTHLRPSASASTATATSRLQAHQADATAPSTSSPAVSPAYRISLVALVIRMCSSGTYAHVSNFEWYIDTLVDLSYLALSFPPDKAGKGLSLGARLRDQLIDVAARVRAI